MFNDPQFWVFVAFVIFIAAIFKPFKKILTVNLDKKINEIKDSINKAEEIKNEAQQSLSEIKKRQIDLQNEVEKIEKESKAKITLIEQQSSKKLSEQINKRKLLAESRIEQMVRDANIQVQKQIIKLAINASIELIEKKIDVAEKKKLINNSIAELNSNLNLN